MFIKDVKRVIEQVSRDKGIESDVLIKAVEEAIKSAAKKKFGNKIDVEVKYNEESGEIEVFQFKEVVVEITEPERQILFEEGQILDPECEIGDSLGIKTDTSTFGRIAAQSAKQVIIQKMKEAERDAVYSGFIGRKGEIINGIVQRFERNDIIVNLGHTEGILMEKEQVAKEKYRRGDRIRSYIMDVRHDSRGPQVILSRTHPEFLICLFRTEVPEISEGIVNIMGAARDPGSRSKFAVISNDTDIDPIGACVGMKGSRVQNVVQELRGEKIDIITWHADPAKFVCNALAPAEISRVIIDEENRSMEVIVPDEFLSIAIGKGGQNVRLASRLTKWRLDVKNEKQYNETMQDGYDSLMELPGMGISLADALYEKGFFSAEEICNASEEELVYAVGISEEDAHELIECANDYVLNGNEIAETSEEDSLDSHDEDEEAELSPPNEDEEAELSSQNEDEEAELSPQNEDEEAELSPSELCDEETFSSDDSYNRDTQETSENTVDSSIGIESSVENQNGD